MEVAMGAEAKEVRMEAAAAEPATAAEALVEAAKAAEAPEEVMVQEATAAAKASSTALEKRGGDLTPVVGAALFGAIRSS